VPPLAGEGIWAPGGPQADAGAKRPPALYETAIRPDPARPEALVRLVALDLRQLDLRLAAGVDWPRSAAGIRGSGRLPLDAPIEAAFAAGPAAPPPWGTPLGFAEDGWIFRPPVAEAATVAIARDGQPAFGPWPFGAELPVGITSLAQAPGPLGGRAERSALCRTNAGQVIYAWGADLDAGMLAGALSIAGCTATVHLAASPAPAGFAYLHAVPGGEAAAPRREATLLAPEMSLSPARLAGGVSPNALFYAVRRDPHPPGAGWTEDAGQQPTPAWLPAIYGQVVSNLGAQVHLVALSPGRLLWRLRAGGKEPATKAAAALPGALAESEQGRALLAIGIGAGRKKGARGLAIEGAVGYPFKGEGAGILVIDKGQLGVAPAAGFTLPPGADATELPLTADEGKLRPEAREVGSMRPRAAVCVLDDGTAVVASTTFDSDEAATAALLEIGCARVVALDRGAHHNAFLHRAGTEAPPSARYESSALYAVDAPMAGRAALLSPK